MIGYQQRWALISCVLLRLQPFTLGGTVLVDSLAAGPQQCGPRTRNRTRSVHEGIRCLRPVSYATVPLSTL